MRGRAIKPFKTQFRNGYETGTNGIEKENFNAKKRSFLFIR